MRTGPVVYLHILTYTRIAQLVNGPLANPSLQIAGFGSLWERMEVPTSG